MNLNVRTIIQISLAVLLVPAIMITGNTLLKDYPPYDRPDWVWVVLLVLVASYGLVSLDIYLNARKDPVAKNMRSTNICLAIAIGCTIITCYNLYQWLVIYSN
ncbi:hypothetical protein [Thermoactinomyces sp. DSM 45892]|uniref:hypothetical protein n=1 Tax=Thermoactinomyces sp. DSM 45892 TaxID=1882753 RepID=UPI000899587E|nr:hypothetical protein [Thermoactinomyces sp. DSM 45892]SDZ05034.1 hypothetical protein SAMN05444416_11277 [Thermoactinomyces sp. DSM 45892]